MKKAVWYVLMGVSLLGCGSDESRPGILPGLGATPPNNSAPSQPSNPPVNPNEPPIDSSNPPPFPDNSQYELLSGIYEGSVSDGNRVKGLIDDNKLLWFLYTDQFDNDLGFVGSNDKVKGDQGAFEVKGKNYSYESLSVIDIVIEGNYQTPKTLSGSIYDRPSNVTTYDLTYDDTLSNKTQSLTLINNRTFIGDAYVTTDNEGGTSRLSFATDGKFTGSSEDCSISGKFSVSSSKRYFIASVTFGNDSGCSVARRTFSGVALLDEDNDLIVLGKNEGIGLYFSTKE